MRRALRALVRGLAVAAHVVVGLGLAVAVAWGPAHRLDRPRLARWWHTQLLRLLHVRVVVRGAVHAGGHLSVANHVSWLDIPVLASLSPTRFVAKAEIRDWPLAGQLASASGALYLRRGHHHARTLLDRIVPLLVQQQSVTLFAEGTTTDGHRLQAFHARLFAAAIEAERPVQPVALRYEATPDGREIAPFIGDDDLLRHLLRVLREPELCVSVQYGAPLAPGSDRSQLAAATQQAVEALLGLAPAAASSPPSTAKRQRRSADALKAAAKRHLV